MRLLFAPGNKLGFKHGHASDSGASAEYRAYCSAKARCTNPRLKSWKNYGGRGIQFKFDSFQDFLDVVGPKPGPKFSLDRINNDKHYERGNLRWADGKTQIANRRVRWLNQFSSDDLIGEMDRRGFPVSETLDEVAILYSIKETTQDMGWENVSVMDIPQEAERTGFEPVPNASYVLQLLGAETSRFKTGAINVTTAIADEGSEYKGRRIFIDIPNPDDQPWAVAVLNRMLTAMGTSIPPYSDPIQELNKIAQNGHSRFTADVYTETFQKRDGSGEGKKNKVNYRSIRAAA